MRFEKPLNVPKIKDVKIHSDFWSRYISLVGNVVVPYQWEILNDKIEGVEKSSAIRNFKIAAGLEQGDFYGMVFQDSDVYKWLEAASYVLEANYNEDLDRKVNEVIDLIEKAQWEDGYINTYFTIKEPQNRWTNLQECHELYCAGHLIEAAVAYYLATGNDRLLNIARKFADHINNVFGPDEGKLKGYPGHQEIELALIKLYEVTKDERYLNLARYFIEERGKEPYYFDIEWEKRGRTEHWPGLIRNFGREYAQTHLPVRKQKEAVGHAVRATYMYSAMADIARITKDEELLETCKALFKDIVTRKMYITGGIGASAHGESFSFEYDLPNDRAYAETCASVGLIFFAHRMFLVDHNSYYYDVIEQILYNNIIGSMSLDGRSYFYVNPLEVIPKACEKRWDTQHVKVPRQRWFGCACCPPNVARLLSSIGKYIYAYSENELYVNLYISNEYEVDIGENKVKIILNSDYPFGDNVLLRINVKNPLAFDLKLRIPKWCVEYKVFVNGKEENNYKKEKEYVVINKTWKNNDEIFLNLITLPKRVKSHPRVKDNIGKVAIMKGPILFCLEEVDNGPNLHELFISKDSRLEIKFEEQILNGLYVVYADGYRIDEEDFGKELYREDYEYKLLPVKLKFIPYYAWANRGKNEMRVWINEI
ncbi:glycoside hydrolase family 127 protein [Caldicellulosiruptor owensensis]|nr:beta-L-arabinofuranosidase domain-containing protein [Caldicellulosiruptor owensensis]